MVGEPAAGGFVCSAHVSSDVEGGLIALAYSKLLESGAEEGGRDPQSQTLSDR